MGIAQSCALIPGISRSGSTICTAIYQNVDRKEAADFSFLMLAARHPRRDAAEDEGHDGDGHDDGCAAAVLGTLVAFASGIGRSRPS